VGIIRRRAGCHEVPAEGINCVLLSRRGALMYGLIISRASYVGNTVMSILSTKETRCRVKLTSWMINVGASTIGFLTKKCLLGPAHQSMMTLDIMSAARGWMDFSTAHIHNASTVSGHYRNRKSFCRPKTEHK
jgi:hypothetical protein